MIFCKFGDLIKIKKSNKFYFRLKVHSQKIYQQKENIIIDTVSLLENFFKTKFNIRNSLKKNLPISSGMGGGSSNAATVFRGLKIYIILK